MMNKKITLLLLTVILGCDDESLTSTKPANDMVSTDAVLTYSGSFANGPYGTVSGMAEVFEQEDGSWIVKLSGFNTTNGPDLYVYLSEEAMPINFISLGKLKSTNGNQVYSVPGSPDFSKYQYISIHCKEYNHLFGYSLLVKSSTTVSTTLIHVQVTR